MARQDKVGTHKTTITTNEAGNISIIYHSTVVVKINKDSIQLNSGGWQTNTTKTRMNQASSQFDLGFSVYQKQYKWYVDYKGKTLEFFDLMVLD
jgi:hypothetical protein